MRWLIRGAGASRPREGDLLKRGGETPPLLGFVLCLMLAAPAFAMTVSEYHGELRLLDAELARGDGAAARRRAAALTSANVTWQGESLVTDGVALAAVVDAKTPEDLRKSRRLLQQTIQALGATGVPTAHSSADDALLERLRKSEAVETLSKGGEVAAVPAFDESAAERVAEAIRRAWDWTLKWLERFFDWILDFWPKRPDGVLSFDVATTLVVTILVGSILLLIAFAAWRVLRRRVPDTPLQPVERSSVKRGRDEDPLSREANEWERYALELTAQGRVREAIRAWYHAVLVSLYRSGAVHYRKGRTNWEYVSRIGPETAWRPRFVEMTRTFEREWYGHSESSREALESCAHAARDILSSIRKVAS